MLSILIATWDHPEAAQKEWERRAQMAEAGGEAELVEKKTEEVLQELKSGKDPMADPAIRARILERSGAPMTLRELAEKHKKDAE